MFDGKAFGEEIVSVVKSYLAKSLGEVTGRVATLEARQPERGLDGKDGEDGKSVDPDEVCRLVAHEVEQAVKSLPRAADGHTPTIEELIPLVETAVVRAVADLPKPKDGEPGPPGQDGKSIDATDVADIVQRAFAEIRIPAIAAPDDVAPVIGKAIALLAEAPPLPGWSVPRG
jgi:hypothetical protein